MASILLLQIYILGPWISIISNYYRMKLNRDDVKFSMFSIKNMLHGLCHQCSIAIQIWWKFDWLSIHSWLSHHNKTLHLPLQYTFMLCTKFWNGQLMRSEVREKLCFNWTWIMIENLVTGMVTWPPWVQARAALVDKCSCPLFIHTWCPITPLLWGINRKQRHLWNRCGPC